jgi:hypothetical protein
VCDDLTRMMRFIGNPRKAKGKYIGEVGIILCNLKVKVEQVLEISECSIKHC